MASTSTAASSALLDAVISHFQTTYSIPLSRTWVSSILPTIRQPKSTTNNLQPVLASLDFRLKSSDLSTSLVHLPHICLPPDITSTPLHKQTINHAIWLQLVECIDMGSSKIDTLDRIEMAERGEVWKGKEVVRHVVVEDTGGLDGSGSGTMAPTAAAVTSGEGVVSAKSIGPHKLVLEDANGERCFGIENKRIDKIDLSLPMGTKFIVKKVPVLRGVLLLEPGNTTILGGKIEEWQKIHLETRKERLRSEIAALRQERG